MQPENLEPRVTALEGQVRGLRDEVQATRVDVAAARELASGVDRDVSEMRAFRRATTASFNALRADMVDMRGEMRGFRRATTASVNALRADMVDMRGDMTDMRHEMRTKFDLTAAGQRHIAELIQQVIDAQGGTAPA